MTTLITLALGNFGDGYNILRLIRYESCKAAGNYGSAKG
jgi:hypothetical protein